MLHHATPAALLRIIESEPMPANLSYVLRQIVTKASIQMRLQQRAKHAVGESVTVLGAPHLTFAPNAPTIINLGQVLRLVWPVEADSFSTRQIDYVWTTFLAALAGT
jgi:hypothetical protein